MRVDSRTDVSNYISPVDKVPQYTASDNAYVSVGLGTRLGWGGGHMSQGAGLRGR